MIKDKTPITILLDFLQDIDYKLGYYILVKYYESSKFPIYTKQGNFLYIIHRSYINRFIIVRKDYECDQPIIDYTINKISYPLNPSFYLNVFPFLSYPIEIQPPVSIISNQSIDLCPIFNRSSINNLILRRLESHNTKDLNSIKNLWTPDFLYNICYEQFCCNLPNYEFY